MSEPPTSEPMSGPVIDTEQGQAAGRSDGSRRALSESELRAASHAASRGLLWILSSTVLWQIVSWVVTLATARILSPSDYGLIALADTITPYLVMLATLRIDSWVLQLDRFSEEDQTSIQAFVIAFGGVVFLGAIALAPLLANFYNRDDVIAPYCVLCTVILIRSLRVIPEARLRRQLRFRPLAISNFVIGVLRALTQLGLAMIGWRYWSLVTSSILAEIFLSVWMIAAAGMPKRIGWNRELVRGAVKFGVPASLSHICWIIFSTADNLVVGRFFGVVALGFYSMAFYLTELPLSKLNAVLSPVVAPYYSRLRYNIPELGRVALRVNRISVALVAPVLLGLCAVAEPFISVVFGSRWLPLIEPFRVMCLVSLLRALSGNTTTLLLSLGLARHAFIVSLIPAVVMPAAFVFGAWMKGLIGVYAAWLIVYPFVGPVLCWIMVAEHIEIPLRTQVVNVASPVIAAAVMGLVVGFADSLWTMQFAAPERLGLDIALGMGVGALFLRCFFWQEARDSLALLRTAKGA